MSAGSWAAAALAMAALAVGRGATPLVAARPPVGRDAPCVRLSRPGTQVQGDVRICPGRYRIADPAERGVLIAAASGTRIDLAGVTIESGDSVPDRYVGIGVASRGVDAVTVLGGTVRGFRFGVRLEGGRNHRLSGMELSGSRRQSLRSRAEATDTLDRLDVARLDAAEQYGAAVLLRGTTGAVITGIIAHAGQNGIGLVESRDAYVADNDLADNNGWAVHLFRAARNAIVRNVASRIRRCPASGADCLAAAVLVREGSDSNTIADNDLTGSSIGVLVTGLPPVAHASVGNMIYRNDASLATVAAFAVRGTWGASLSQNRADSAAVGFELTRVRATLVRDNTVIGSRTAAVELTRSGDAEIEANVLLQAPVGVRATAEPGAATRGVRIDDNMLSQVQQGVVLHGVIDSRVRGNVFDGVRDGLVIDGTGHATAVTGNVFLRASGWFIDAPDLVAGGNYWATADARQAGAKVRGRISVLPWMPASEAGY